jgi:hypothetical protein
MPYTAKEKADAIELINVIQENLVSFAHTAMAAKSYEVVVATFEAAKSVGQIRDKIVTTYEKQEGE